MSTPDATPQYSVSFFEAPLLPLIRDDEEQALAEVYQHFFTGKGMFTLKSREKLLIQVGLHGQFYPGFYCDLVEEAARKLAFHLKMFRPKHQNPEFHPLLTLHAEILQDPHAQLLPDERALLERLSQRVRRALPALRAGAAAGLLAGPSRNEVCPMGTGVLLADNRFLAPAGLFGPGKPPPDRVFLGVRYPGQIMSPLPLDYLNELPWPSAKVVLMGLVSADSAELERGLPDEAIVWEAWRKKIEAAIWYYKGPGEPARCALGSLSSSHKRPEGLVQHGFNDLGPYARGAPIFDKGWRLVALYLGPNQAVCIHALQGLRPPPVLPQPKPEAPQPEKTRRATLLGHVDQLQDQIEKLERALHLETHVLIKDNYETELAAKREALSNYKQELYTLEEKYRFPSTE